MSDLRDEVALSVARAIAADEGDAAARVLQDLGVADRADVVERLEVLVAQYRPIHEVDLAQAAGFTSARDLTLAALEDMTWKADHAARQRVDEKGTRTPRENGMGIGCSSVRSP